MTGNSEHGWELHISTNNYIIKRSKVLLNILEYIINNFDIIAILYKDLILENKLNRL